MLLRLSNRLPVAPPRLGPPFFFAFLSLFFALFWGFSVTVELPRDEEPPEISLPDVQTARADDRPDPERLVIRIPRDGSLWISGAPRGDELVREALMFEARLSRAPDGRAEREVQIRADARTPFQHVRKVINWCREPKVGIHRLSFGIRPELLSGP